MRLGRGGSIKNLYAESLFCEIAKVFFHILISSKRLKERTMQKSKRIFNSLFEGETVTQLSLGNIVRSI